MRKTGVLNATNRSLWLPQSAVRNRNWPVCMTCGRDVDAVNIVGDGTNSYDNRYVDVMAKCHGAEDVLRVQFESAHPTPSDLQHALRVAVFFDPEHADAGFSAGGI